MKTVIEMAREAGFLMENSAAIQAAERFAELVRADEWKSRAHSLGPGQMELSLRRNHKDELFECRRRFSAEELRHGPDWMVKAAADQLEIEMDRAIQDWSNT